MIQEQRESGPHIEALSGSLDEINGRINDKLTALRAASLDEAKKISTSLNDILYNAIRVIPHLVTGIEVKLKPGIDAKVQEYWEKYGIDVAGQRRVFQEFQKNSQGDTIVVPLPYIFTTGTHGSGERNAIAHSKEEILFDFISPRDDWNTQVPVLAVGIKAPFLFQERTPFTLDEVESVRLVKADKYSPYAEVKEFETKLVDRANPVISYLVYRNFNNYRAFISRSSKMTDQEWEFLQTKMINTQSGDLWDADWRNHTLRSGFIATVDGDQVTLYEMTKVKLEGKNVWESQAILMTKILREGGKAKWLKSYKGDSVIERLAKIPVGKRRF